MVDEEIIFLFQHLYINDEILNEILVYLEAATSEIDNIYHYILELQSKISELEQNI